jgi:hypothetical protein
VFSFPLFPDAHGIVAAVAAAQPGGAARRPLFGGA